jgi:hypothetical protein
VPTGRLLIGMGESEYPAFRKTRPGDLQSYGQAAARESAWDGNRRQSEYIEPARIPRQHISAQRGRLISISRQIASESKTLDCIPVVSTIRQRLQSFIAVNSRSGVWSTSASM